MLEQLHRSEEAIAHQQRLQIIGTMTGGIAHEFNNLLTPILGHADLLQLEVPEDSEIYESVREISDAAVRCKEIIRQLSSLSRKNVESEYQSLPAGRVLGRILKMIQSVCPSYVQVQGTLDLGDIRILGNETQLQQVILNICVNAFQAMAGQGGTLTVTGQLRTRQELGEASGGWEGAAGDLFVQLDLADTGCGMSSDTLEQIFDPFFTTKPSGQGTGLGLSLAQQIVRSHRGSLYAESELGHGSVFHLLLPAMEPEGQETMAFSGAGLVPARVLLAGDNPRTLAQWAQFLAGQGISASAVSWAELPEQLRGQETHVLVADCGPDLGRVLAQCQTLHGTYSGMRQALMAERKTREAFQAQQQEVFQCILEKPVSNRELLRAVEALLGSGKKTG